MLQKDAPAEINLEESFSGKEKVLNKQVSIIPSEKVCFRELFGS